MPSPTSKTFSTFYPAQPSLPSPPLFALLASFLLSVSTSFPLTPTNPLHCQGIVIAAKKPEVKATNIAIQCKTCKNIVRVGVRPGFGSCVIPRICEGQPSAEGDMAKKCGVDPFVILPDKCSYVDRQVMALPLLMFQSSPLRCSRAPA